MKNNIIKIFKDVVEEISDDNRSEMQFNKKKNLHFPKKVSDIVDVEFIRFFRPTIEVLHEGKIYKIIIENKMLNDLLITQKENSYYLQCLQENRKKDLQFINDLHKKNSYLLMKFQNITDNWLVKILVKLKIIKGVQFEKCKKIYRRNERFESN